MVGYVVRIGKTTFADYNGKIFKHPNVNVAIAEGRSFLRAQNRKYDIIQIYSNHTSSSIAAGTGAMATTYLQTAEAYKEYFEHLEKDGILHINYYVYPKMIATAAYGWRLLGRSDFRKHVVVFERDGGRDYLPTLLIKNSPWTKSEVDELIRFFSLPSDEKTAFSLVESPFLENKNFLSPAFYSGNFPGSLPERIPYRIKPPTDDRPYFNFLRKVIGRIEPDPKNFLNPSTAHLLNSQMRRFIPMDIIHFVVTSAVSLIFAILFVFLPLSFSPLRKSKWPNKEKELIYFSCLGAGFIIFELVFIQIFMKLIGFPLYTISTVIFVMLFAAGAGSFSSSKLGISLTARWHWPFVGIVSTTGHLQSRR